MSPTRQYSSSKPQRFLKQNKQTKKGRGNKFPGPHKSFGEAVLQDAHSRPSLAETGYNTSRKIGHKSQSLAIPHFLTCQWGATTWRGRGGGGWPLFGGGNISCPQQARAIEATNESTARTKQVSYKRRKTNRKDCDTRKGKRRKKESWEIQQDLSFKLCLEERKCISLYAPQKWKKEKARLSQLECKASQASWRRMSS